MFKLIDAAAVIASIALGTSLVQAQTVAMAGQYSEANGIIVNIPQNPPNVSCTQASNARCVARRQYFGPPQTNPPGPLLFNGPQVGNRAALLIPNGSLSVGGTFTIPPLAFTQMLGNQVGQVLNNIVVQIDTDVTAVMPEPQRAFNPPVQTREFAVRTFNPTNVAAHGQNNGLSPGDPNYVYRQAVNTTVTDVFGTEMLNMSYSGGNGFSGTMVTLLDGSGRLYLAGAGLDAGFPPTYRPIVGTNPLGDPTPELTEQGGAGWAYTATNGQASGLFKGFPSHPSIIGTPCLPTAPPSPAGCNLIQTPGGAGFDDVGIPLAPLGAATSTKFMFAWTTGTVSIVRTAVRQGLTQNDTLTGMGYDTVTTGGQRNIGLVAGSYSQRTDGVPTQQMNTQIVGATLKFTPEPVATLALLSGLGLLGAIAARKKQG